MVLLARPKVQRRWLVAGEGGTAELRREVPTMASPCCLIRARYELHEVTKELSKPREEDDEVSVVGGRGELRSGETLTWRTAAEVANRPSPKLD